MTPARKKRATLADMVKRPETIGARRLRALYRQVEKEVGGKAWGSHAKIASKIGINEDALSRFINDPTRDVAQRTLETVARTLKLRGEFFTTTKLKDPHYTEFLDRSPAADVRPIVDSARHQQVDSLLETLRAGDDEREAWSEYATMFPDSATPAHVQSFLFGLRKGLKLQAAIDHAVNEVAESDMRASGRRKLPDASD